MGKKKLTYTFVKDEFEEAGYTLLTKKYINNAQKLDYICPEGHKYNIRWSNWRQGARCFYCNIINRANKDRLDINFIRSMFEKEKYHLLTTKYVNDDQKLDYICPEGHKHSITWNNWQKGVRCRTCWCIRISGSGNSSWKGGISCEPYCQDWTKEYKEYIKERDGYKCLNPDCWKKDDKAGKLSVHHIDYNKKNCKLNNLITVCASCNSRANFDRDWHQAWYDAIIYMRYYFTGRLFK